MAFKFSGIARNNTKYYATLYNINLLPMQTDNVKMNFCFTFPGDVVLKPAWGKDQPNNYNGEQNCVVLDGGRNWLWNDVGCNLDYLHFICQHGKF